VAKKKQQKKQRKKQRDPAGARRPQPGLSERLEALLEASLVDHPHLDQPTLTQMARTAAVAWNTSRLHPHPTWAGELQAFAEKVHPDAPIAAADLSRRLRELTVRAARIDPADRRVVADVRVVESPQGYRILAAGMPHPEDSPAPPTA